MAKKSNYAKNLLGATDAFELKNVALGSFLAFFVFCGSFWTSLSAIAVVTGEENALIAQVVSAQPTSGTCGPGCGYSTVTKGTHRGGYPGMWTTNPATKRPYGDTNGDGNVDPRERDAWNATHNPDGSPRTSPPPSGGGGGTRPGSPTGSVPKQGASIGDEYNCLSATGCD